MTGYIQFVEHMRAKHASPYPAAPPEHEGFVIGCDLGQVADFTALCVLEKVTVPSSEVIQKGFETPTTVDTTKRFRHLRHLQRLKLGTDYPTVAKIVGALIKSLPPARIAPALVVDATGTGRPVIDMMRKSGLRPIAVTITAGYDEIRVASDDFRIPKRNLVSTLAVLMQSGRLKVAPELAEAETFVTELSNFKVKISAAGHDSFNSWRDSIHDDLVLSVALAAWWSERKVTPTSIIFDLSR